MDKRQFLKGSGLLLTGAIASRISTGEERPALRKNWSGNYTYSTDRLDLPTSTEEVQQLVKSRPRLKALGTCHSFNGIADSTGDQVSLKHLDLMILDEPSRTVTVGGGVPYGRLAPYLDAHGYALHNLASLPHISVAGACATATHGSGSRNRNLSSAVSALELVKPNGDVILLTRERDGERFRGAVVGLGALGIVTKVTLDLQPSYRMTQAVYENLSFTHLEKHLDEIFASGYSVSLFTDWQSSRATQVWIKRRIDTAAAAAPQAEFFGAKLATVKLHPVAGHAAESCTEQMGVPGTWFERLPHFRMNFTPSSGAELQSEYFVPRDRGYEAIRAVEKLRDRITPHLLISELRTIDADDLWMSPCYNRPSMTIHFTWKPEWPAVRELLPLIEKQLAPFDARPHWAKLFTIPPPQLRSLYAKTSDYQALIKEFDPQRKLSNQFLSTNIYG